MYKYITTYLDTNLLTPHIKKLSLNIQCLEPTMNPDRFPYSDGFPYSICICCGGGVNGNGIRESTPQIRFVKGLPHMNSFAIENKMCVDNDQKIYIPSILNASRKKIDYEKKTMRNLTQM